MLRYHYDRSRARLRDGARARRWRAGEIGQIDPEVTAYALMGLGELVGMRWILWGERDAMPERVTDELERDHPLHPRGQASDARRPAATASYLPERWMTAAEIAARDGIPEQVIVEKFGLRGKHIAAPDEHVSDLSVGRSSACSTRRLRPEMIDVVMYFGSMWKDYAVWQAAPWIAHRIGATNAFAVEYDNVSHGTPIALRLARDLLRRRAGAAQCAPRRRLARVVPARLRERALALHVQLRRRRGRRAARARRAAATSCSARTRSPTARSRCR